MCEAEECECKNSHKDHQMRLTLSVLETVDRPLSLPEELTATEKSIDMCIEGLIKQLEDLRTTHKQYVKQHVKRAFKSESLRSKLIQRQVL